MSFSAFTLSQNDQSIYYLGQLFGTVGSVLNPGGTGGVGMMSALFQSLNVIALGVGGLIMIHAMITGLLKSAGEGEFLKKQGSIMTPVRMILGIMALVPTATGYSVIQIFLMWTIVQGVKAADTLWTTALNYVAIMGSPYAGVNMPVTPNITMTFKNLFIALSCEATTKSADLTNSTSSNAYYQDTYNPTGGGTNYYYYCADPAVSNAGYCGTPRFTLPAEPSADNNCLSNGDGTITCPLGPAVAAGKAGACGSIQYQDQSVACAGNPISINCMVAQAQVYALQGIIAQYAQPTAVLAKSDHDYLAFNEVVNTSSGLTYPYGSEGATTNWVTPDWLLTYCATKKIGQSSCCVSASNVSASTGSQASTSTSTSTWGSLPSKAATTAPVAAAIAVFTCSTPGSTVFPAANNTISSVLTDYGNMTYPLQAGAAGAPDAVGQILFPYAMKVELAGTSTGAGIQPNQSFFDIVSNYYLGQVSNGANAAIVQQANAQPNLATWSPWEETANQLGWIMAGSFYFTMSKINSANLTASIPTLNVAPPDLTTASGQKIVGYRNNIGVANDLITLVDAQNNTSPIASAIPQYAQIGSAFSGSLGGIANLFIADLSGGTGQVTNPLANLQSLGQKLMQVAQYTYLAIVLLISLVLAFGSINVMTPLFGLTENPAARALNYFAYAFWGLVSLLLAWLVSFGGLLAVYTPLVPYVIFTFGSIGWFTATIEGMIAGPLIALGIMWPGEHEILGRAAPALLILFNLILRPSLMIIGMIASMLMAPVVVSLINAGFLAVMSSVLGNSHILVELIIFLSAYVMLVLGALNKCFALIHIIPSKVLAYIGGQAMSYGEEEGLRDIKQGMDSTMKSVGQAMGGAVGSVQESLEKALEGRRRETAKNAPSVAAAEAAQDKKKDFEEMAFGGEDVDAADAMNDESFVKKKEAETTKESSAKKDDFEQMAFGGDDEVQDVEAAAADVAKAERKTELMSRSERRAARRAAAAAGDAGAGGGDVGPIGGGGDAGAAAAGGDASPASGGAGAAGPARRRTEAGKDLTSRVDRRVDRKDDVKDSDANFRDMGFGDITGEGGGKGDAGGGDLGPRRTGSGKDISSRTQRRADKKGNPPDDKGEKK